MGRRQSMKQGAVETSRESSVFSGGSVQCCESINSSDLNHGNTRFWKEYEAGKATKIWSQAKEIGINVVANDEVYIAKIGELEAKENEAEMEREENGQQS